VAVAVSGGPDSVALAWLLDEMAPRADWTLAGLIHVNHGLRGPASDADEAFCRDLAERMGLAIDSTRVDTAARALSLGRSVEVAARELRYEAFEAAATRLGADIVATGHTLEDQAETVLMRLLRGAGSRGLSAIRRRRGLYIRPLLDVRRQALRDYLRSRGESYREDASNADVAIPRNRIRHELLPVIERIAPGGLRAIARSAALAEADEAFLETQVIQVTDSVVLSGRESADGEPVRLRAGALSALPGPVARRLFRDLAEQVSGRSCTVLHVDAAVRLARADYPVGHLDLPGLSVDRRGDELMLCRAAGLDARARADRTFEYPLPVPGIVEVPEAGVRIAAELDVAGTVPPASGGDQTAVVRAAALARPLVVRSRREGDRFRPLGAPGRRKLQDVLVDRKVPRAVRDRVPLVVDAAGRIVWVAGVAVAHDYRVTASGEGVVVLKLTR